MEKYVATTNFDNIFNIMLNNVKLMLNDLYEKLFKKFFNIKYKSKS